MTLSWIRVNKIMLYLFHPFNNIAEILVRAAISFNTIHNLFFKIHDPFFEFYIAKQLFHLVLNFPLPNDATLIFVKAQPNFPNITNVALVKELICKVMPTKEIKALPLHTPSMVEFQPQWLKKHATEGWRRTCCWGAQPTISLWLPIRSLNPSGHCW